MTLSTASMSGKKAPETALYECIRGVVLKSGVANPGDIVELTAHEAKVFASKFVPVREASVEFAPEPEIEQDEFRVAEAPAVEHRDPVAPRPRGRPRK